MTIGKEIIVHPSPSEQGFHRAKKGDIRRLVIHGLEYPPELRANPPRVRLLEDGRQRHTRCELLDPWPDAPVYWPPASEPGRKYPPESFWHRWGWLYGEDQ